MSFSELTNTISAEATAAITANRIVKLATTAKEQWKVTTSGAGEASIGVATNDAASGEIVTVAIANSVGRIEVDGSSSNIAAGDPLKANASGIGVKASSGDNTIAIALEPSTASGDIINCVVTGTNAAIGTTSTGFATVSTTSGTVTAVQLTNASVYTVDTTNASATALAIPGAASVPAGRVLIVKRTGGANAVTITPAAGTINGGASYNALDAVGDAAMFVGDGAGDWKLMVRTIA